jgi:hypothetical protein
MNTLAILEYMFVFDPTDTWQHGSQFEKSLSEYFYSQGFDVSLIDIRGGSNKRAIQITKRPAPVPVLDNQPKPKSINQQFQRLTQERGEKGQFKKPNT